MPAKNPWKKFGLHLVLFLVLCITDTVFAKEQLDAGKIIGGQQGHNAKTHEQGNASIERVEEETLPSKPQGPRMKINSIHITGQNIYSEDTLKAIVKDILGSELTFAEMEALAERIATYLHRQGYIVAVSYIPVQEITDGNLEIRVILGRYGRIVLDNRSGLSDGVAISLLHNIKTGDYVKNSVLERTLLLLSDAGSISSSAVLAPGLLSGTTDLIVELKDTVTKAGQFSIDNYGSRVTGQTRINTIYNITNIQGTGASASFAGTTAGQGFYDINLGYTLLAGCEGARMSLGYYQMHYALGKEFAALHASGKAQIVSLNGTYPIMRSRSANIYASFGYDRKTYQDIHASPFILTRNNQADVWHIGLTADGRDKLGGANSFEFNLYSGRVGTNDLDTSVPGWYTKAGFEYIRWQYINSRLNFLLKASGQFANQNLDSTEKFFLGGPAGLKAFSQGEISGDQGYLLTGELRFNMPTPLCQAALYFEQGSVTDKATLSGAGLGLIINGLQDYCLRIDYAWKVHAPGETGQADKAGRFWLQAIKYF